jgi:DNA-binding transcriptional LysR family regulator
MDRFEAMRTLIAAVDGGSLSAASRMLNMPLPTVSRRVADLEARLGAQLLVRTSRKLILTEAGEAFVGVARRLLDELSDAERAASGEYRSPRGELLVTAPVMFGKLHVAPIVHAFLTAYPEVTVRLVLSDQVIDLIEAHVDVAVRIGRLPDSDLIARQVGYVCWIKCASPDYLAQFGEPATPDALIDHRCIAFAFLSTPQIRLLKPLRPGLASLGLCHTKPQTQFPRDGSNRSCGIILPIPSRLTLFTLRTASNRLSVAPFSTFWHRASNKRSRR